MQAHYLQGKIWANARAKVDWQSRVIATSAGNVRVYTRSAPLVGLFGYAPLCVPVLDNQLAETLTAIKNECDDCVFVKLEPEQDITTVDEDQLKKSGLIKPAKGKIQYQSTVEIHLDQSEDDLLMSFSKGTRYNIRKAEKRGVSIVSVTPDTAQLEELYRFKTITSDRADHYLRPKKFLLDFWGELAANDSAVLLRAEHEGQLVAIGLSALEGDRAWNIATGSLRDKRSLSAPSLMHWQMMQQLKSRSINRYDMTGISPPDVRADKENPMAGVDSFKTGFGEQYIRDYPGTYDLVLNQNAYSRWNSLGKHYVRAQTKLSGNYWW